MSNKLKLLAFYQKFSTKFYNKSFEVSTLLFPNTCVVCETELSKSEKHICNFCDIELASSYEEHFKNQGLLDEIFWGRGKFERVFALYLFEKKKGVQQIIHEIKYKHNLSLGKALGQKIAEKINDIAILNTVDAYVPVPIHHKKEFQRGYNQSKIIAEGIASITNKEILNHLCKKVSHTNSQTKKNRWLREKNTENQFTSKIIENENIKHVCIVDDVITTGATIEALSKALLEKNPELRISVICIAATK